MRQSRLLLIVLVAFVLGDLIYSYWQHSQIALDGDLAAIVVPAPAYQEVLDDPLGLSAFVEGKSYAGPNRYFAHASMRAWMLHSPLWLQTFLEPIDSIYASTGLAKTLIQLICILGLAAFISGQGIGRFDFWLAAAIVTPFFQTFGYNGLMGVIDKSITYTFFYALPLGALILFFFPFYKAYLQNGGSIRLDYRLIYLLILAIILPLSGPLVAPVAMLVIGLWGLRVFMQAMRTKQIPNISVPTYILLGLLFLICVYSFYIGTFNAENAASPNSLIDRYAQMPKGLFTLLSQKLGFPLLIGWMILNLVLIRMFPESKEKKHLMLMCKWIAIFAILYLLLLPFGGYRSYRPLVIRRDTFLPITLCLMFLSGYATMIVLKKNTFTKQWLYPLALVGFLALFTLTDTTSKRHNACERIALEEIAKAETAPVKIEKKCTIMAWNPIQDPVASQLNAELLFHWHVTEKPMTYMQP